MEENQTAHQTVDSAEKGAEKKPKLLGIAGLALSCPLIYYLSGLLSPVWGQLALIVLIFHAVFVLLFWALSFSEKREKYRVFYIGCALFVTLTLWQFPSILNGGMRDHYRLRIPAKRWDSIAMAYKIQFGKYFETSCSEQILQLSYGDRRRMKAHLIGTTPLERLHFLNHFEGNCNAFAISFYDARQRSYRGVLVILDDKSIQKQGRLFWRIHDNVYYFFADKGLPIVE